MADRPGDDRITAKPTLDERLAGDDVARLATAPNPAVAHIWEQVLREEGIPSRVVGDYLNAALGDIPGFSAEVWVHQSDLARAQEILERHRSQSALADDEQEEGIVSLEPGLKSGPPPTE